MTEEEGDDDIEEDNDEEGDEYGLSHSMKVGAWKYMFLSSTLHSLKPIFR